MLWGNAMAGGRRIATKKTSLLSCALFTSQVLLAVGADEMALPHAAAPPALS